MESPTSLPPLPHFAPFPKASWRTHMAPEEWSACHDAWILLVEIHLSLSIPNFQLISAKDESISAFLLSYMSEAALSPYIASFGDPMRWKTLWKRCFILVSRLFRVEQPPGNILKWEFLSDFCRVYGKGRSMNVIESLWIESRPTLEGSLKSLKISLVENLVAGVKGNPKELDQKLKRLNHILFCSPSTASFFMTGSDFLDSLLSCYELMSPQLRKTIISTTYLSILGLTEGPKPRLSLLTDQLYCLKAAAYSQKAGSTNGNDSLVAELVSDTPFIARIKRYVENDSTVSGRTWPIISSLEGLRKVGGGRRMKRFKGRVHKDKGPVLIHDEYNDSNNGEIHIHRMSLITQIQDLFPDLGSRFVISLLDEYDEDVEQVIFHLLEDSLPTYLRDADRGEELTQGCEVSAKKLQDLVPRPTPPLPPTRRNVFDNDEFDQLTLDASRLNFGRRDQDRTADDVLMDSATAPSKATILSALAAFDSDDDERDDTYDVEDVGGSVDATIPGNNPEESSAVSSDTNEETLFRAFKTNPRVFGRDAATRRSRSRKALRDATGITDEAIEGWALMLSRDLRRMRRLETRFSDFSGTQPELISSSWKADLEASSAEESDGDAKTDRGADTGLRGRGGYRRAGKGRDSNVAGPAGERETGIARQRKEANKDSRANQNHNRNRRDQRAYKMTRGGVQA